MQYFKYYTLLAIALLAAHGVALAQVVPNPGHTVELQGESTAENAGRDRGDAMHAPAIPLDSLFPLQLTTFDGSGQVVHPDVVVLPNGWQHGTSRLAMAITPYPYGNPSHENPSVFTSDAGIVWTTPAGGKNPVERPSSHGYLSDPALVFDPSTQQLRLYYREVVDSENVIRVVTTADGVHWSLPRETIRVPSQRLVSPSVVRRSDSSWLMWSVDAGPDGCSNENTHIDVRRSDDGVTWGTPSRVELGQSRDAPWHIDVKWIDTLHEYWALYNLKVPRTCLTYAVYLATSPDGVHWTTYAKPVLQRGASPGFADVVYRSSFVYTKADDMVTFYFSGARWDGKHYVWSGAVERRGRAALFADLERPIATVVSQPRGLPSPERPADERPKP